MPHEDSYAHARPKGLPCRTDWSSNYRIIAWHINPLLNKNAVLWRKRHKTADVTAYFLMQRFTPNGYIRKQKAQNYLERLTPVLNTRASYNDKLGIVRL
jgi:hypothetical protein